MADHAHVVGRHLPMKSHASHRDRSDSPRRSQPWPAHPDPTPHGERSAASSPATTFRTGTTSEFVLRAGRPLYVGLRCDAGKKSPVVDGGPSTYAGNACTALLATTGDPAASQPAERCVRIQAVDLRQAGRKSAMLRADAAARDCPPPPVLVDIEVLIDRDAASARNMLAQLDATFAITGPPRSLRYIGTPTGLAGLIADIHILGIADGVMLLPLMEVEMVDRVFDEVFPMLGLNAARRPAEPCRPPVPAPSPECVPA